MNIEKLVKLINIALYSKVPAEIINICGRYYQPYYYLMYLLAKEVKQGIIVELGVSSGYGINSFALGNPYVTVIGFDLNVAPEHKERNVDFHLMSALPVPSFITNDIAILHVDTEHSYANASNEFNQYKSFLLPGAVVMFDDLHAKDDDVLRFFNELPYPKIQEDRLHPICGYGVMIYETNNI